MSNANLVSNEYQPIGSTEFSICSNHIEFPIILLPHLHSEFLHLELGAFGPDSSFARNQKSFPIGLRNLKAKSYILSNEK